MHLAGFEPAIPAGYPAARPLGLAVVRTCTYFPYICVIIYLMVSPLTERCKASACILFFGGIAGSSTAEGMNFRILFFVCFVGRGLCDGLITRSGDSYSVCVCVCVCVMYKTQKEAVLVRFGLRRHSKEELWKWRLSFIVYLTSFGGSGHMHYDKDNLCINMRAIYRNACGAWHFCWQFGLKVVPRKQVWFVLRKICE